jgi:hypothetical protein
VSVGLSVYPFIVALGKDVPSATKNYWRLSFLFGPCRNKVKQAISSSKNLLF